MTSLKPWQIVLLALVGLLTTLSAGYFGRDYSAKKEVYELQERVATEHQVSETTTAKVKSLETQTYGLQAEVATLRKSKKTWEKGTRTTGPLGVETETWEKGTDEEEDSLKESQRELTVISRQLEDTKTTLALALTKTDAQKVELLAKQEELRRVTFHGAVLAGWDMSGGLPLERAQLQAIGALGPLLMGLSVAPGGPWAKPGNLDSLEAISGSMRPTVWAGLKL